MVTTRCDSIDILEYNAWLIEEVNSSYIRNTIYGAYFAGLHISTRYTIKSADLWALNGVSPTVDFMHKYGTMTRKATILDKQTVEYKTVVKIPARRISIESIKDFNKWLDTIKSEAQLRFYGLKI